MLRNTPRPIETPMVRSHLVELMRRHQLRIAELARLAEVNRSTVTALTRDRATRVDLGALERICTVLGCGLGDLLEIVPEEPAQDNDAPLAGAH
ncbi:MAG TPA: helix-turn-helix transcriptional regulator [Accumulibacter sp.]|nr:helix-turn-helix transcriptional regulator [Accumulibacter sp.]